MIDSFLFEKFKDTNAFSNENKRFKIKLKFPKADIPKIHRMIVNYQVKKYGQNLGR